MVEFMDAKGNIVRMRCDYYKGDANDMSTRAISADELVIELLRQLPPGTFIRGPWKGAERK